MDKFYIRIFRHTLSVDEEDTWIDIAELDIHPEIMYKLAELGIVEVRRGQIPACQVMRAHKILRLRRDLGVNLPGAAIILDLLEQVEELRDEIERLKRR